MEEEESLALKVWLATWRTGVQLFYIVVVAAIFATLQDPHSKLIAALCGLLYSTIRTGFIGIVQYLQSIFPIILTDLERLKSYADSNYVSELLLYPQDLEKALKKAKTPIYFHQFGLSIIYFICLFELFATISSSNL